MKTILKVVLLGLLVWVLGCKCIESVPAANVYGDTLPMYSKNTPSDTIFVSLVIRKCNDSKIASIRTTINYDNDYTIITNEYGNPVVFYSYNQLETFMAFKGWYALNYTVDSCIGYKYHVYVRQYNN